MVCVHKLVIIMIMMFVMILYWKLKESTFPCLILDLDIIFGNKSFQTTLQRNSCHFMSIKLRSWRIIMKETRTFSNLWRKEKHCLRQWRNLRWFSLNNRYYLLCEIFEKFKNWIVNKLDILFLILSREFVAKFLLSVLFLFDFRTGKMTQIALQIVVGHSWRKKKWGEE